MESASGGRLLRVSRDAGISTWTISTPQGYSEAMDSTNTPFTTESPSPQLEFPRTSTSYAHDKAKILARLRRIEGQVRGVQRMVEDDVYCLDVLTQLSAIIAAARQTGLLVLEDHVRGCVADAWRSGND